jgi:hypothetical protein
VIQSRARRGRAADGAGAAEPEPGDGHGEAASATQPECQALAPRESLSDRDDHDSHAATPRRLSDRRTVTAALRRALPS